MLYNNPFTSGVDMSTELMLRIEKSVKMLHILKNLAEIFEKQEI